MTTPTGYTTTTTRYGAASLAVESFYGLERALVVGVTLEDSFEPLAIAHKDDGAWGELRFTATTIPLEHIVAVADAIAMAGTFLTANAKRGN